MNPAFNATEACAPFEQQVNDSCQDAAEMFGNYILIPELMLYIPASFVLLAKITNCSIQTICGRAQNSGHWCPLDYKRVQYLPTDAEWISGESDRPPPPPKYLVISQKISDNAPWLMGIAVSYFFAAGTTAARAWVVHSGCEWLSEVTDGGCVSVFTDIYNYLFPH